MRFAHRWAIGVGLAALLSACGGGDGPQPAPTVDNAPAGTGADGGALPRGEAAVGAVILVTIDDLRVAELAPYGGPTSVTPRFADLARAGLTFTDANAASAQPAAALMSVLSGVHPAAHGVSEADPSQRLAAHPDLPRLASALRAAGWSTAAIVSERSLSAMDLGQAQGIDEVVGAAGDGGAALVRAADLVRARAGGAPAFLWVHVEALRDPRPSAASLASAGLDAAAFEQPVLAPDLLAVARRAVLAEIDAGLGRLALTLVETGATDQTLLVVAGVAPGSTGTGAELGALAPVVRRTVAAPLFVCARADLVEAGKRSARPVGAVDIAPTIAELTGVAWPATAHGRSFVADLTGALEWAGPLWIDTGGLEPRAAALRWGNLELAATADGARRLHDVVADPTSQVDLLELRPAEANLMAEWMGRIEAECAALRATYPARAPGP